MISTHNTTKTSEMQTPQSQRLTSKKTKAILSLSLGNGLVKNFHGTSFGAEITAVGEVVFQTGMVGYPESLTDPSYCNQILVLTYPLIGSYGVPDDKIVDMHGLAMHVESDRVHISALVVGEYVSSPSHHQSTKTLSDWLVEQSVPGIQGIDTRRLTKLIRENGTIRGIITTDPISSIPDLWKICWPDTDELFLAAKVCRKKLQILNSGGCPRVMVVDCGIKNNQIRMLLNRNAALFIVGIGQNVDVAEFVDKHEIERIFISNGPGDPRDCVDFYQSLGRQMEQNPNVPIFGICLGHQLLALAAGHNIVKMKYGNRGHNIPCKLIGTNRTFVTTQNHGYAVELNSEIVGWQPLFKNLNDGSNEGIFHRDRDWFSCQFHPEAKGGPEDTGVLFDVFLFCTGRNGESSNGIFGLICHALKASSESTERPSRRKVLVLGSGY